jgi:hypothetical protein
MSCTGFQKNRNAFMLTFLSNYLEMDYLELFELEILSRDLIQVFTLTNKNRRITELNENKISY